MKKRSVRREREGGEDEEGETWNFLHTKLQLRHLLHGERTQKQLDEDVTVRTSPYI